MATKKQPLGICDHCLAQMPEDRHFTSKGKPRLYCSRDCRNTANSRAGSKKRSVKAKARVRRGEWQNPHHLNPPSPEEQARRARLGRLREVQAGTWRNPALSPEARKKLSRPRKHSGPLRQAIRKLGAGAVMADLAPEEQAAHRQYRKKLRDARRQELNAYYRRRYHKRQAAMTSEEKEAQRRRWREASRRRRQKKQDKEKKT